MIWISRLSKGLSLVVAGMYMIAAASESGWIATLEWAAFLFLALSLIWFSEGMAEMIGDEPVPAPVVALGGWCLLALPLVYRLITHLSAGAPVR